MHAAKYTDGFMEMPRHFAGGAASGDIDGDGDIDLFITRGDEFANLLLINENGQFSDQAVAAGVANPGGGATFLKFSGPVLADMDGDNDLDLFIGGLGGDPSFFFANDGSGNFTDVTVGSGIDVMTSANTISAAFGDYDLDGDLDLAMAHWGTPRDQTDPGETETLWRNDSDASGIKFTPVSKNSGIADQLELNLSTGVLGVDHDYTFAPNFADVNDDGYPDLLSVSDFNGSQIFLNNQDGTFTDITDRTQITDTNGMGAAVGDFDSDGDMDWFVSSINGNRLYQNSGGNFVGNSEASDDVSAGAWGWASCFADFDLDGHLDIYQTNGWVDNNGANPNEPFTEDKTRLWMADGSGGFSDKAIDAGVDDAEQGRGAVCADFDNDGDVDVLLLINASDQAARLWVNDISNTNWLKIRLVGEPPNTQALGAKIYLIIGSQTQTREMSIGSNFISHNPAERIFGMGADSSADELKIVWPDGRETVLSSVTARQTLTIRHPDLP